MSAFPLEADIPPYSSDVSFGPRTDIHWIARYPRGVAHRSSGGDGAAIAHVFGAGDGPGAVRGQEDNQVGHFLWLRRSAERNAAKRLHDDLLATLVIRASMLPKALGHSDGGFCLDPAGRDADHTDSLRRNFFR